VDQNLKKLFSFEQKRVNATGLRQKAFQVAESKASK
jgi:hypothetical protein